MRIGDVAAPLALAFALTVAAHGPAQAESLVWTKTKGDSAGRGVAVARDRSVYVAGATGVGGGDYRLLQKYSPGGTRLWSKVYDAGGPAVGSALSVAEGGDGSVLVAGWSLIAVGYEYPILVQKYSRSGALLWSRTYNAGPFGFLGRCGVAVAGDGSVYVAGSADGKLVLLKYTASGSLLWDRLVRSAYGVVANGVALGPQGQVYVVGTKYFGNVAASGAANLLLQRYTSGGTLLWSRSYNGVSGEYDSGYGVAVDAQGAVFVTGIANLGGVNGGDVLVLKYSSSGAPLWARTWDSGSGRRDYGFGLAIGPGGGVWIAGAVDLEDGRVPKLLMLEYAPNGDLVEGHEQEGRLGRGAVGYGAAVGRDGSLYVVGDSLTSRPSEPELLLQKWQ